MNSGRGILSRGSSLRDLVTGKQTDKEGDNLNYGRVMSSGRGILSRGSSLRDLVSSTRNQSTKDGESDNMNERLLVSSSMGILSRGSDLGGSKGNQSTKEEDSKTSNKPSKSGNVVKAMLSSVNIGKKSSNSATENPRIEDISNLLGSISLEVGAHAREGEEMAQMGTAATGEEQSPTSPLPRKLNSTGTYENKKKRRKNLLRRTHSVEGLVMSPKRVTKSKREGRKTKSSNKEEKDGKKKSKNISENTTGNDEKELDIKKKKKNPSKRDSRNNRRTSSLDPSRSEFQESMDLSQLERPTRHSTGNNRRTSSSAELPLEDKSITHDSNKNAGGMDPNASFMDASGRRLLRQRMGRSLRKSNSLPDDEAINNHNSNHPNRRRHRKSSTDDMDGSGTTHRKREGRPRTSRRSTSSEVLDHDNIMNTSSTNGMDSSSKRISGSSKRETRRARRSSSVPASNEMDGSSTNRREGSKSTTITSPSSTVTSTRRSSRRQSKQRSTKRSQNVEKGQRNSSSLSPMKSPRAVTETCEASEMLPPAPDLDGKDNTEQQPVASDAVVERRQRRKGRHPQQSVNNSNTGSNSISNFGNLSQSYHRGVDSRSAIHRQQLQQRIQNAHHHAVRKEDLLEEKPKQHKSTGRGRKNPMMSSAARGVEGGEESLHMDASFWSANESRRASSAFGGDSKNDLRLERSGKSTNNVVAASDGGEENTEWNFWGSDHH